MIAGHITLEDLEMHFSETEDHQVLLTCEDELTKKSRDIKLSFEQLGAIGLSICGTNEKVMDAAYPIAEAALPKDWPPELRPMP